MDKFITAIQELSKRKPVGSPFNSSQWQRVAPAIRQKSFFSATVTSTSVLTRWREMILKWMDGATEEIILPDGSTTTAYKEVSLAKFRERAATFAIQEGLADEDDFADAGISNVISNSRMKLVFNTNIEQAQEFAYWKDRMENSDYLNLFPAARFVRRPGGNPKYYRMRHVANEGVVKRWDDIDFWLSMNLDDDGGFGVPWGPWGFNSYMYQEPVKRSTAERLGLVQKGERIKPPKTKRFGTTIADQFLGNEEEEIKGVPDELRRKAAQRITDRLGPNSVNRSGRPSLKALREARKLLEEKFGSRKPAPKPESLTVYHGGELDWDEKHGGLLFTTPQREQAEAYADAEGAPVTSFTIDPSTIASEEQAFQVMEEIGIAPLDPQLAGAIGRREGMLQEYLDNDPVFDYRIGKEERSRFIDEMRARGFTGVKSSGVNAITTTTYDVTEILLFDLPQRRG